MQAIDRRLLTLFMSLIFISTALAQDHTYIPMEPGNELWYENTGDPSLGTHIFWEAGPDGASIFNAEALVDGEVVDTISGHFTGNDEGDVIWIGPEIAGNLIPFTSTYLIIDAPLFAGKTWSFETSHPNFGTVSFTAEVVAEEWVTAPGIGDLYCYKVHYDETWSNVGQIVADRWYADGFGEVQFLTARAPDPFLVYSAIVIPVEQQSLSEVRSIFH